MNRHQLFKSALSVQEGIEQPEKVNPYLHEQRRPLKKVLSVDEFTDGILSGNRVILSQAITLIESTNPAHFDKAQAMIEKVLPHSGRSIRVGITGVPGVGKSTFIESFGKYVTNLGKKLAVLAIDPSSERSRGSILGDKTRMEDLSHDPNAFIRPSPSGLNLGGVARKTRESIILCEASGFDVIIVETVGVGQSETVVKSMVDFFLLLMLAGAGDELQGIKRGIMEMADAIIINKADGDNIDKANLAKAQYRSAIHLFPKLENGWDIPVETCSALEGIDISKIWDIITDFEQVTKRNDSFQKNRDTQLIKIFYDWINDSLKTRFYMQPEIKEKIDHLIPLIRDKEISPYQAGNIILNIKN